MVISLTASFHFLCWLSLRHLLTLFFFHSFSFSLSITASFLSFFFLFLFHYLTNSFLSLSLSLSLNIPTYFQSLFLSPLSLSDYISLFLIFIHFFLLFFTHNSDFKHPNFFRICSCYDFLSFTSTKLSSFLFLSHFFYIDSFSFSFSLTFFILILFSFFLSNIDSFSFFSHFFYIDSFSLSFFLTFSILILFLFLSLSLFLY
ncbi:unnamed protein product [Acanthosepion pharaonis]|uniref:Uncharacterized protein n=1 Tax=Acanthosepion pharaonis TaxID=158019 RepID=A0A812EEX8_ACAPH|nr:unnamed protein product [Sepia pharaonis]